MITSFAISNTDLESNLFPEFYLFKHKITQYSKQKDIISFCLGDKDVLTVLTDGEHTGQSFVEQGALFIKNSSVKRYSISEFDGFYIESDKNDTLTRSKLQKDDVLFTTIGNIGISAVVNENVENANINQNVVRIRINRRFTTPQYLSCFLNSKITRFQVNNLFSGNIYPMLSYPKIKSLKVFIRDHDIENIITQNMILADKHQVEALRLIALAQQLFLKELNINFAGNKNNRSFTVSYNELNKAGIMIPSFFDPRLTTFINKIKHNHEYEFLGDIADLKNGDEVGSVNYKEFLDHSCTDVPFIRTSDLVNYDIDAYPDYFISDSIYNELKQGIKAEEILFTKDGKIGQVAMITNADECILSSGILRIIAKSEKINPYYLFIALSLKEIGYIQAKQRTVVASTIPHLREERICDFIIPIIKKPTKIIELTQKAFNLKNERKKLIEQSKSLLDQSMIF